MEESEGQVAQLVNSAIELHQSIVPTYSSLEEYGKVLLGNGLKIADELARDITQDPEIRLKAVNSIVGIAKHVSMRLDKESDEDEIEDDL